MLLQAVVVVSLLIASVCFYAYFEARNRQRLTHQLGKFRQIFLATFQMATDGVVQKNDALRWPGDLKAGPNAILSVSDLLRRLLDNDYLTESDIQYITSAHGISGWNPTHPDADKNCAFKVYRVSEKDAMSTIVFATRNFTYGKDLDSKQMPYGNKAFVLIRKGGDGAVYRATQARNLEQLGLLPGRKDFTDRPVETPEDTLEQR